MSSTTQDGGGRLSTAGGRGARAEDQQTRAAVGSRDLMGQAEGILTERIRIPGAFALLVQSSQRTSRELVDVADELTRSGAVPTP